MSIFSPFWVGLLQEENGLGLVEIIIFILLLLAIWFALRYVLRLVTNAFKTGCGLILALGILLVILRFLSQL